MCGIYGAAGKDVQALRLRPVGRRLKHRGPDETGSYVGRNVMLGNERLSIVDIAGGQQPVRNETEEVIAVLNGEIYNYSELRQGLAARGHELRSQTDTEVLVHLYEEEGERFVQRLEGMFALALWDERSQSLLLARDRCGVKPLYYCQQPERMLFASELGALMAEPSVSSEADLSALDLYLQLNYIPAPWSAYREVRKLPAGHLLRWRRGETRLMRYWLLPTRGGETPAIPAAMPERAQVLEQKLRAAVRSRLTGDVRIGLFLSGGLDSATVLSFMAELQSRPVATFSAGFAESAYSELPQARLLARRFGAEHHEMLLGAEAVYQLPALLEHFHEPFGDSSALPTYYVSKLAARNVKVVLGGDGGDELLAGYPSYQALALWRGMERVMGRHAGSALRRVSEMAAHLPVSDGKLPWEYRLKKFRAGVDCPAEQRALAWRGIFGDEQRRQLWQAEPENALSRLVSDHLNNCDDTHWLGQAQFLDFSLYLADDILVKLDRMSMAHGLEAREPLLCSDLVEYCFALPPEDKLRRWQRKYLLRQVQRQRLPAAILHAPKRGFSIPLASWLRGPLRRLSEEWLLDAPPVLYEWLRREAVAELLSRHQRREENLGRQIWNLLALVHWLKAREQRNCQWRAAEAA